MLYHHRLKLTADQKTAYTVTCINRSSSHLNICFQTKMQTKLFFINSPLVALEVLTIKARGLRLHACRQLCREQEVKSSPQIISLSLKAL